MVLLILGLLKTLCHNIFKFKIVFNNKNNKIDIPPLLWPPALNQMIQMSHSGLRTQQCLLNTDEFGVSAYSTLLKDFSEAESCTSV